MSVKSPQTDKSSSGFKTAGQHFPRRPRPEVFSDFMTDDSVIYETSVMLDDGAFRAFLSLGRDCFIINAMRVGETDKIRRYLWPYAKIKRTLRVVHDKPTLILIMEAPPSQQIAHSDEELIISFASIGERDMFATRFRSLSKLYGSNNEPKSRNLDYVNYYSRLGSFKISSTQSYSKLPVETELDLQQSDIRTTLTTATSGDNKGNEFDDDEQSSVSHVESSSIQSGASSAAVKDPKVLKIDDLLSVESLTKFQQEANAAVIEDAPVKGTTPNVVKHKFPLATTTTPLNDPDSPAARLLSLDLARRIKSVDLNSASGEKNDGKTLVLGSELIDIPIDLAAIGIDAEKYGNLGMSAKMRLNITLDLESLERVKEIQDKNDRFQAMRDLVSVEMDPCNLSSAQITVKHQ